MDLKERLRKLKDHAPVIHVTFAADVDPQSLQKLVQWFREEVHPHTLVAVGMQPSLIGGVYLRTPNQVHDFSVRALLKDKSSGIIAGKLEELCAR
jgi:F0F1-type ATP synthase delta subunit